MNDRDPEFEETLRRIRVRGDQDLKRVGLARALWPLSMGFLGASVAVTALMLAGAGPVVWWRWALQGAFFQLGLIGAIAGWRARHRR